MLRRILAFAVLAFGLFAATAAAEQLVKSFDVPQGAGAHDMAATLAPGRGKLYRAGTTDRTAA